MLKLSPRLLHTMCVLLMTGLTACEDSPRAEAGAESIDAQAVVAASLDGSTDGTSPVDMILEDYAGESSSQDIELVGASSPLRLAEVRCVDRACRGTIERPQGSSFMVYALVDAASPPRLLTPEPIVVGPNAQVLKADLDGDGKEELLLSGQERDGTRNLKICTWYEGAFAVSLQLNLPYGTLSQLVMDIDEDGVMEIVTLKQTQDPDPKPGAYNPYTNHSPTGRLEGSEITHGNQGLKLEGRGGPLLTPDLLGRMTVQVWQVVEGKLKPRILDSHTGLKQVFETRRAAPGTDILDLARGAIMMHHYGQTIDDPQPLLTRFMRAYDERIKAGERFMLTPNYIDDYARAQRRKTSSGAQPAAELRVPLPSYDMHLLLGAMKVPEQDAVLAWNAPHLARAVSLDELSAHLELEFAVVPERKRAALAVKRLDQALAVLLKEGKEGDLSERLTSGHAMNGHQVDEVRRHYFIASFLLHSLPVFEGREASVQRFLAESLADTTARERLLPQPLLAQAVAPHLAVMDFSELPQDFIPVMISEILPGYVSTSQADGGPDKKERATLAASLRHYISEHPEDDDLVWRFVAQSFPDASFKPLIKTMMKTWRARPSDVESSQAEQSEGVSRVALLFPLVVESLSSRERTWWLKHFHEQRLTNSMLMGCHERTSPPDDGGVEVALAFLETISLDERLVDTCLAYLGEKDDAGASPLTSAQQARLMKLTEALPKGGEPRREPALNPVIVPPRK